jgi:hypothetical protein
MTSRLALLSLTLVSSAVVSAGEIREIIAEQSVLTPKVLALEIEVPQFSIEHQVRLALEARIDWPDLAGSNPWLTVAVNDNWLTADHLLNKRNEFRLANGMDLQWYAEGYRWRVLYSPDFTAAVAQATEPYAVAREDDPYRFVWDITRLVKPGRNRLVLNCLQVLAKAPTMVLRQVQIEVGPAIEAPRKEPVAPAPTGQLPTLVTRTPQPVPITVGLSPQGHLVLAALGQTWQVATRTSLPGAGWQETVAAPLPRQLTSGQSAQVAWQAGPFRLARTVTVHADHASVSDSITNTGPTLAGLILHHRATPGAKPDAVFLAGTKVSSGLGRVREPANPSVLARYGQVGLGVVAEDDVLRLHALCVSDADGIGLTDDRLALDAGTSVTLEWSLYPLPDGDYWSFVNAVRRAWEANVALPGPFIFNSAFKPGQPAEVYAEWARSRSLKYICGGIAKYPDGKYAHGTGICFAPQWVAAEKEWTQKLRAAAPEVTPLQYFHAQICTEPDSQTKYADCKLLDEKGEQVMYPYGYPLPGYVPTRENAYGKALWGYVNTLVDDIGVGGVYWDEQAYSVDLFHYGEPWDGVTGIVDPQTGAVTRKISCVTLLMQPLQLDIIRHLRGKGLFLMANGQAHTRTIAREKVVFFTECGTYSALGRGHLGSPVGLGNHHPEDSVAASARHVRDMLRYGSVYHGHYYRQAPPAWNFTSVMYPITPVELHAGYVLGAERIHTTVSGRFGWPDGSAAAVYVVNAGGERVEPAPVREVLEDGRRLYELRLPGDQFAILVRQDAAGPR